MLRQTWQAVRFVRRMVLDPLTYPAVVTVLFVVVLLATWLPSRGAAPVDPVMALRGVEDIQAVRPMRERRGQ